MIGQPAGPVFPSAPAQVIQGELAVTGSKKILILLH